MHNRQVIDLRKNPIFNIRLSFLYRLTKKTPKVSTILDFLNLPPLTQDKLSTMTTNRYRIVNENQYYRNCTPDKPNQNPNKPDYTAPIPNKRKYGLNYERESLTAQKCHTEKPPTPQFLPILIIAFPYFTRSFRRLYEPLARSLFPLHSILFYSARYLVFFSFF